MLSISAPPSILPSIPGCGTCHRACSLHEQQRPLALSLSLPTHSYRTQGKAHSQGRSGDPARDVPFTCAHLSMNGSNAYSLDHRNLLTGGSQSNSAKFFLKVLRRVFVTPVLY